MNVPSHVPARIGAGRIAPRRLYDGVRPYELAIYALVLLGIAWLLWRWLRRPQPGLQDYAEGEGGD